MASRWQQRLVFFMRQAEKKVSHIIIVGGGSAGWITAGLLASRYHPAAVSGVQVTVIESPDVKTIGVGEGSWPTMRATLRKIGINESEFIARCAVSLKQGTRFHGWVNGRSDDVYYHPFSVPVGFPHTEVVPFWQEQKDKISFAHAVTAQASVCDHGQGPKQATTPDYAHVLNYGYHLDAGQFAEMLKAHCVEKLGVHHILDHVVEVKGARDENIQGLVLATQGPIEADLYIDCTGQAAMLIEGHYGVELEAQDHVLFNDRAWAAQVPYDRSNGFIQSQTNSTAQEAGWIWDIALTTRRGIGYVYSSKHSDDERALETLWQYLRAQQGVDLGEVQPRPLAFEPGYRKAFWRHNCVAVGMSAGFIEPLEASALVMIELAANQIAEELPATHDLMPVVAERFNQAFSYRWGRIIDFLKLHYILSQRRDTPYWVDHRNPASMPDRLSHLMALWQHQVPGPRDFPQIDEIFSAASYQYVLYGMGFETQVRPRGDVSARRETAHQAFRDVSKLTQQLMAELPDNRLFQQQLASREVGRKPELHSVMAQQTG